jgi:hypothetical protein
VENSNLKKTEFYNISAFLGFLAPVETTRKSLFREAVEQ